MGHGAGLAGRRQYRRRVGRSRSAGGAGTASGVRCGIGPGQRVTRHPVIIYLDHHQDPVVSKWSQPPSTSIGAFIWRWVALERASLTTAEPLP